MTDRNSITSQCLICARIYYDQHLKTCPRCKGICRRWPASDERLMLRNRAAGDRSAVSAINEK